MTLSTKHIGRLMGLLGLALSLALPAAGLVRAATAEETAEARQLIAQGKRFEHGVGAPQQLDQALNAYCQAADLGLGEAGFHLGWLYASGRLGATDEVMAAAWLQRAQAAGYPQAEAQLRRLRALDRPVTEQPRCLLTDAIVDRRLPPPGSAPATDAPTPLQAAPDFHVRKLVRADIIALVRQLAPDFQLDPELVLALIQAESNFDPTAHSPKDARGLMQLIPATAQRFGVQDIWDPVQNMRGGMAYLRWLLDHFNGDRKLALAGYNAGEGAVRRYGGIPPFPETQAYVKRIIAQLEPKAAHLGRPTGVSTTAP
ncbi:MAG: lytic transglycosylase domain-containing protein [Lamprobacter sp.]|uniref:lytic transglycosylase domain-containing protein n=1 Tax=Lamprobacter sp. TaxID=3100796 RepID=UPI002B25DC96|nr:lytic transglycosylase domain-containing protein [Lamprobacter sp.]MEA3640707.1 lytic transglycosylase domain-containing protein [Lamprobacter sp.]